MNYLIKKLYPLLVAIILSSSCTTHSMDNTSKMWLAFAFGGGVLTCGALIGPLMWYSMKKAASLNENTIKQLSTKVQKLEKEIIEKDQKTQQLTQDKENLRMHLNASRQKRTYLEKEIIGLKSDRSALSKALEATQTSSAMTPVRFKRINSKTLLLLLPHKDTKEIHAFPVDETNRYVTQNNSDFKVDKTYAYGISSPFVNRNYLNYGIIKEL